MERTVKKWRYALVLTLVLAAMAVFSARLIRWQIFQSDYYNDIALTSTEYNVSTDAIRGEIYDVNGVPLAVNKTGYRVLINKIFMPDEELNATVVKLVALIESCGCKWIDELPIIVDANGEYA